MKKKTDKEVAQLSKQLGVKESLIQKEMKENNAEQTKIQALDEQILQQQNQINKLSSKKVDLEQEIAQLSQHDH